MLKNPRLLPLLLIFLFFLNLLIYIRANMTLEGVDTIFAECARNSGRTSASLNLMILFLLGYFGLKSIYKDKSIKKIFTTLVTLFTINHLIHFFFVSKLFSIQSLEIEISVHFHGFITYLTILFLPIILLIFKDLTKILYAVIILHFFNATYFIGTGFYSRIKPIDPAYMHQIGIVIMIAALIYILYRIVRENMNEKV